MSGAHSFDGVVQGGPLDGERIVNNASKGFVLIDLDNEVVWVHDYKSRFLGNDLFIARDSEPLDFTKLEKAQNDGGRSLIVYDEEVSDG